MGDYLECGKIINTHGLAGEVKLESWCDSPNVLAELGTIFLRNGGDFSPIAVTRAYVKGRFVFARLEGVDTVEKANEMRDTVVYARREDVPLAAGACFIADLIGLPVIDADSGKLYGTVSDVFNAGASDIYTVATPQGERMMPAVAEFVDRIEIGEGIYIRPIEGMFDV